MSAHLVAVTAIGRDRPGIVAGVAKALFDAGCNLQDVSSTILRGHFSMVLIVTSPEMDAPALENALVTACDELGLGVTVRPVGEVDPGYVAPTHMVSVYGADKPGIVYRVADALAHAGANVTDLTSRIIGEEDRPVYALMLEVAAEDVDLEAILNGLRDELNVDASVHPLEADLL